MAAQGVENVSGKEYLIRAGKIAPCSQCPFFRSCWNEQEYDKKSSATGKKVVDNEYKDV